MKSSENGTWVGNGLNMGKTISTYTNVRTFYNLSK